jgi:hypothetical protein
MLAPTVHQVAAQEADARIPTAKGHRTRVRFAAQLFGVLWLFITFVSVHDGYMVALRRDVIRHAERNPLGQYLIARNGGDIWLLLAAKAAGTTAASSLLLLLHQLRRQLALFVAGPVACFQFGLLLYMTCR